MKLGKEIVGIRNTYSLYVISLLGHGKTINYLWMTVFVGVFFFVVIGSYIFEVKEIHFLS